MGTNERIELIEEIEGLAAELGVSDLPTIRNLRDKSDLVLLTLRDGLVEQGGRDACGTGSAGVSDETDGV